MKFSSAEAICYGDYITAEYDQALFGEVMYEVPTYNPSSPQPSVPQQTKTPPAKKQRKSAESKSVAKKKKRLSFILINLFMLKVLLSYSYVHSFIFNSIHQKEFFYVT